MPKWKGAYKGRITYRFRNDRERPTIYPDRERKKKEKEDMLNHNRRLNAQQI
jgi:hypothetical protein